MSTEDYSPRTIVAYRSRLKILRAGVEAGVIQPEDMATVKDEIATLERKLGDRAESPRQGRPRKFVKLTMAEIEALKRGEEVDKPGFYSEAQTAIRRQKKQEELLRGGVPEEVQQSEQELNEMIAKAQEEKFGKKDKEVTDGNEGPKATDEVSAVGGITVVGTDERS